MPLKKNIKNTNIKEDFVATITHQLRSPLTTIKFVAEAMLKTETSDDTYLTDEQTKKIKTILEASGRALNLISNLLGIMKLATKEIVPKFEACELISNIKAIIDMLTPTAAAKNQKIILNIGSDIHIVKICNEYLERAIQNVIDNAIHYGDENSEITINLVENNNHEYCTITVKNIGPIIPKDEIPKMFEKFHRVPGIQDLNPEGTGLGLFIAKSAIELNGGKIWIESDKEKGTVVHFTVPFKAPKAK